MIITNTSSLLKKLGPKCDLSNNRIKSGRILNQSCVAASILESMLLTDHSKNLFQQTASKARFGTVWLARRGMARQGKARQGKDKGEIGWQMRC